MVYGDTFDRFAWRIFGGWILVEIMDVIVTGIRMATKGHNLPNWMRTDSFSLSMALGGLKGFCAGHGSEAEKPLHCP